MRDLFSLQFMVKAISLPEAWRESSDVGVSLVKPVLAKAKSTLLVAGTIVRTPSWSLSGSCFTSPRRYDGS